ncbi:MAG TPA: nuclear transport factor 2 family protein [Thermoleophilaceae bacterium]|nr:nuclear transport factor 2 family protein [Thermoleophilaceae bacterium]
MSQENVELSHRAAEAFNRRDLAGFLALHDEDVQGVPLAIDMDGDYLGHDGTRRWWGAQFASFPDLTIEICEMRDPGDLTIAALRMRGHGAGGAVPVDMTIWRVSRWRNRKCIWWGSFRSESEALQALGLPGG